MIEGRITIISIDYENSFRGLLPKVIDKSKTIENPGLAIRFLNKMGDDSLPVILKIMAHMGDDEKEELLIAIIEENYEQISEALNKYLKHHDLGDAIQIEEIHAVKPNEGEGFGLVASGVKIRYDTLIKTELVSRNIDSCADILAGRFGVNRAGFLKGVAKTALLVGAKTAPESMEKKAIELINRADINEKITAVLRAGLEKIGLYLQISDMALMQAQEEGHDSNVIQIAAESRKGFRLSRHVEESLLDAVVAYLKENDKD